jgi:3-oxoadipate CoA-transferase alpha subunit
MKNKIYSTFREAVDDIPDGSTIMFPGFGPVGHPRNLMAALLEQGAKDLTGIANGSGGFANTGPMDLGRLIEAKRFRKMVCAFTSGTHPSRVTPFETLHEAGEIESELVPQGTLAERIRAAAAGIGAFYTPASVGTELAVDKEHRTIDGRQYVLEYPLHADYAFVHAWRADSFGNLQFRRSQRNFNPIMAQAARITIVEVEEDILEPGTMEPDNIHTSGIFVDRIVKVPPAPEGIWELPPSQQ